MYRPSCSVGTAPSPGCLPSPWRSSAWFCSSVSSPTDRSRSGPALLLTPHGTRLFSLDSPWPGQPLSTPSPAARPLSVSLAGLPQSPRWPWAWRPRGGTSASPHLQRNARLFRSPLPVSLRSDAPGFGGWLGGHEWRRSAISSNPSDEATSESEPESSAQSVGVDPAPRPTRRSFTAAYKAEIVAEYEGAPHGEEVRGAAQGGTLPLPHQLPPRLGRRTYG